MIRLRFGTFLRLSVLGIVINFPFLIKNLVLLQFASKQNFGGTCSRLFSDKECNFLYHSRYSECDLTFPILILGVKCKIKIVPNLDCHYTWHFVRIQQYECQNYEVQCYWTYTQQCAKFIEYIMTTWHCAKNTECIVTPGFVLKLLSTLWPILTLHQNSWAHYDYTWQCARINEYIVTAPGTSTLWLHLVWWQN